MIFIILFVELILVLIFYIKNAFFTGLQQTR